MSNTNCTMEPPIRPLITKALTNLSVGGNPAVFDLLSGIYSYTSIMASTARVKRTCNCKFISQRKRTPGSDILRIWMVE